MILNQSKMVSKKLEIRAGGLRILIKGMNGSLLKGQIGLSKSNVSFFIEPKWAMNLVGATTISS
jgi:hypothetical protein